MKVGIVGAGLVGTTTAFALMLRGACSELVLIDQDHKRAEAEAADLSHAAPVSHSVRVSSGDYSALAGAKVVILTAGVSQAPGESRLDLLAKNAAIFREVVPQVIRAAPDAALVVATNPVDILTSLTAQLAPGQAVIGSGTLLDSARFRSLIAERAGVNAQSVHAYVLGEHGDSEVLIWSNASVAGVSLSGVLAAQGTSLDQALRTEIETGVRDAAASIIAGKKATNYGVAAALAQLVDSVLRDQRRVLTVSAPGDDGVAYSLPRIVGARGVLAALSPALDPDEQSALDRSVQVIRETLTQL